MSNDGGGAEAPATAEADAGESSDLRSPRILLVSNAFPPQSSARAIQVLRLAEGLGRVGAEVHVLTRAAPREDESRLFRIHEVPTGTSRLAAPRGPGLRHGVVAWRRWQRRRQWVASASRRFDDGLRELRWHAVVSFSNPFENHSAAAALREANPGLLWLAYWSDPWPSTLQCGPYRRASMLARLVYERQARRVLLEADAHLFPNRCLRRHLEAKLGVDLEARSAVLPHIGSPPPRRTPVPRSERGWIVHLGSLDRERIHPDLVRGLSRATASLGPERFRGLRQVGTADPELGRLAARFGAEAAVRIEPPVPQEEVGALANRSQALLVVEAPMERSVYAPSKFADYALTGRPILCITPPSSALRDLVANLGGASRVHFCDYREEAIARALSTLWEAGGSTATADSADADDELARYFSQERVASELVRYLESRLEP